MKETDKAFAGSIPRLYDECLVPLIFAPYATDLAARVKARSPARVLEIAAGTGAVTRSLAATLPEATAIVSTDLNQAMLDHAATVGTQRAVEWRQADAMTLPFGDAEFDVVVCQFGAMFFPDKAKAFNEARRVLKPGGAFLFNVWDRIEENEFADAVTRGVASLFPNDPPRFLARIPHGFHDPAPMLRDLAAGGFGKPALCDTVAKRSRADSPRVPALAYCGGTPLRNEIEAKGIARLAEATDVAERAVAERFGTGAVDGKIQAHVFTVER